jgi:NADH:ubiquinone oxidoreductase subunit 5 (subunit L)/multisubunit Na+/H+ antiporter MnhA subunit
MSNRVGDLFLFIRVLMWAPFVSLGSGVYGWESIFNYVLLGAAITKRAQFPFRGWLPKAMAAPTPTRALVHSRTLVTAGLLVIVKFMVPIITRGSISIMLWVGLLTMTIAGVVAMVEEDVKKVVALRTLSQMGLSMRTIGVGYY